MFIQSSTRQAKEFIWESNRGLLLASNWSLHIGSRPWTAFPSERLITQEMFPAAKYRACTHINLSTVSPKLTTAYRAAEIACFQGINTFTCFKNYIIMQKSVQELILKYIYYS